MTTYNVDVEEIIKPVGSWRSRGTYRARCRENGIEVTGDNVEHDICLALKEAGYPDGALQTWRGTTPSLSHSSIYEMARWIAKLTGRGRRETKRG